jgi:hypothetical protein
MSHGNSSNWQFSPRAEEALRDSGWFPSRSVDIAPYAEYFEKSGFTVHTFALSILGEFGGLTVKGRQGDKGLLRWDGIRFDPFEADSDKIDIWKEDLQLILTPFASTYVHPICLDANGAYYLQEYNRLLLLDGSFEIVVDHCIFGIPTPKVLGRM